MSPRRPAGWAVLNVSRGGIYVDGWHWYSDRDIAMSALNWWGRFVYPGEALTLVAIPRWPVPRPAWL